MKKTNTNNFGFHYSPYNFDSNPEKDFLIRMLEALDQDPKDIEDIYFTGGLSNTSQTDIIFEYKDEKDESRHYSPDFVIKKKSGKTLVIEVKKERMRNDSIEGEKGRKANALQQIVADNKTMIEYQMLFTPSDAIGFDNVVTIKNWINKKK